MSGRPASQALGVRYLQVLRTVEAILPSGQLAARKAWVLSKAAELGVPPAAVVKIKGDRCLWSWIVYERLAP